MAPRRDAFEAQHARNRLVYEKRIKQIFTKVCYECGMSVTQLAGIVEQAGKDADFAQIPAVRKVMDKLQRRLAKDLQTTVIDGIRAEWKLANDKYDALIGTMVAGDLMERWDEQTKLRTMSRNLEALDAFIARKEGGLNLSQRVWQYSGQMRDAMEATLQLGISEGESAAEIARDLKQYLNYPDKLFRRVRDAETGELKLSKPASLFHPGQGVYRSSYKNALRLALNETNIAYRKADSVRRVGLYFVVGIEVHLSNNHNSKGVPEGEFYDICDILKGKYPPDFEFVGWHPACRCWTSTILNTDEEFFRDSDGKYRGSVNEVKDVPPQFKKWIEENKERIAKAEERRMLPYFLRDNRWAWDKEADRQNEKVEYRNTALDAAEARHAARTDAQVKSIKDRWAMRSEAMRNFARVERLINSVPGMREYLRAEVPASMNYLEGETPFDGNYTKLNKLVMVAKNQMRHLRSELDVLDRPWEALKEHGVEKILEASQSIRKKIAQWEGQPLDYQLKKLNFEADWVEKNKKGVISTWEVAKNAYLKAAAEVEWRMIWGKYEDEIKDLALNPHADPDMIAEARSYLGKDEAAVQMAIDNIKTDIELAELREEYDNYINEAPGAFNENARREIEAAFDDNEISEVRRWMSAAKATITMYRDNKDKILDLIVQVNNPAVVQKLNEALINQGLTEMGNAIDLAERAIKFEALATQAQIILGDHRDLLLKLKPQVVTWLEERSVPKDYEAEDIVKLKSAVDSAQFWLDEWQKRKDKYAELWQYFINENIKSKEYKDLVMELRQAILDVDLAKADELIPKVEAQKDKHAAEKAYREGIKAEWDKMMADVQKVSDALNKDTDLLARATAAGLTLAVFNFMANADGPKKIREGRKTYKEILDLAEKLGIGIDNFRQLDKKTIDKLLKGWNRFSVEGRDRALRPSAEKQWAALNEEERMLITKYTSTYNYLNEPLRGKTYSGRSTGSKEFTNDCPKLTAALEKCGAPNDLVVRRGVNNYYIPEIGKDLRDIVIGDEFTEPGFLSTAVHRDKGFYESYNMIIIVPAGTPGFYAETCSHYNDNGKYYYTGDIWDGATKETIGGEQEWIGSRGYRFRVYARNGRDITLVVIGIDKDYAPAGSPYHSA